MPSTHLSALDVSGNMTVGGTLAVTGALTATGGVTGAVTGNVAGDVTGDVDGNIVGEHTMEVTAHDADAALGDADFATQLITLDGGASCDITEWTPTVGKMYILTCIDVSVANPTVTLSTGITWDGTNDTATFDAAGETITVVAVSATRLMVVANPNSIAFS